MGLRVWVRGSISYLSEMFGMNRSESTEAMAEPQCSRSAPRWRSERGSVFQAVCGAASLGLLPHLCVRLLFCARRLRVWFRLRQLCNVKDDADPQVKLTENSPELGDQIELHDLTQQRVVSRCMSSELKVQVGGETQRARKSDKDGGTQILLLQRFGLNVWPLNLNDFHSAW